MTALRPPSPAPRCTLHPSDQLALEGPLSRVKSLKKSLRQSFRRIRRSRVSSRKRRPAGPPGEVRPGPAMPASAASSPARPSDLGAIALPLCASVSPSVNGSLCNTSGSRPRSVRPGEWWRARRCGSQSSLEGKRGAIRCPLGKEGLCPPSGHVHPLQVQEGSSRAERTGLQNMELAPVQRKIEARSAEDSFTGFVRTLYFADTYLRDSEWPV